MCTVTFLPLSETDFVLTSSRDVGFKREHAEFPATVVKNDVSLHFPRDGKAGGTWIGTSRDNRLICLLNGAFENHVRNEPYRMSRGHIVLDLLIAEDFEKSCGEINLDNIEPFTLVVVQWKKRNQLFEFVWDGLKRHLKEFQWKESIWSSSTLYNENMKTMRKDWFKEWLIHNEPSPSGILKFHRTAGNGKPESDVFMKRKNVGTVSLTQVVTTKGKTLMNYFPERSDEKGKKGNNYPSNK
ncbi:NRDE family protein [Lutimonas zeaxanthinifaciens]|uniref:NRDE family protein n=1 Tax=Lutimonas zeaxanthinifaciens TaxID=3060215 RepID=UPI00265D5385|nr:NRDE family protein [Lutimonas sp. YSD2104]WKK65561.1 NRDE family protein [Lutimonas sp. YSD2104]